MSYDTNVYYNPQIHSLEIIGEIVWSEPCYDFDLTMVWKSKRGEYWVASDSGCSCPSPFEDYNKIEDLDGPYDKKSLKAVLSGMVDKKDSSYGYYGEANLRKQVSEILDKIK